MNEFDDFKPLDFLQLANELQENIARFDSSSSSVKRNIFGRIYYSIFLFVREWLLKNTNYVSNPKKDHSKIPEYIKIQGPFSNEVNKDISNNFNILKRLRHQSDYYIEVPPLYSYEYSMWIFRDISYALALAEDIFVAFGK